MLLADSTNDSLYLKHCLQMNRSLCIIARIDFDTPRVHLEGLADDLRELAQEITAGKPVHRIDLHVPVDASPAPYDGFLTTVEVVQGGHLVNITLRDRTLVIVGPADRLSILAQNVSYLADKPGPLVKGKHTHIEYYPEHFFLDPDAVPLMVSVVTSQP